MMKEDIAKHMNTVWVAKNLLCYKETGSTNTDAMKLASEGIPNGMLVVADKQTAGRGRRGRTWLSSEDDAVYMSLVLRPMCMPNQASVLTLVMALAVMEAIEEWNPSECGIKWPNDIVMNQKKICGILTEMSVEKNEIQHVVIGVGINVNQDSFPDEIAAMATSLYREFRKKIDRAYLISRVMYYFEQNYAVFEETFDLTGLLDAYNQRLLNRNKQVRVLDPKGEYEGVAEGVNIQGELLVRKADGETVSVYAGEVSVRGIYGYI